jgi:hypothetical protein
MGRDDRLRWRSRHRNAFESGKAETSRAATLDTFSTPNHIRANSKFRGADRSLFDVRAARHFDHNADEDRSMNRRKDGRILALGRSV